MKAIALGRAILVIISILIATHSYAKNKRPSLLQLEHITQKDGVPEEKTSIKSRPTTTPIAFSIEQLPKNIYNWKVSLPEDTSANRTCVLTYTPIKINDGHGNSRIEMSLQPDAIKVNSITPLNMLGEIQNIQIDAFSPIKFDSFSLNEASIYLERNTVIEQMKSGLWAQIRLAYWPSTTPSTSVSVEIDLRGFTKAVRLLERCQSALNKRLFR